VCAPVAQARDQGKGDSRLVRYPDSQIRVVSIPPGQEDVAWSTIRTQCPSLTEWGEDLLRNGLDGWVKSVLVEPRYICKDFRDLYSHFYSKKFVERSSHASRLHFFADPDLSAERVVLRDDELQDSYIGYAVIQPVADRCLGRMVIDPLLLGNDCEEFWCLRTPMRVHLNGAEYTVHAYPWMAQSGEATVCAHAALWGICRYLSERYTAYGEVHPYDLIEMTGSAHGRKVPYRGMTYADYCEILASFGCHPLLLRARTDQSDWTMDKEFFYNLYAFVESGFPVLASFRGHAVALVGHTLDKNAALSAPERGNFYNSFRFVKQFVAVDDNFFPYQLLGFNSDPDNYPDSHGEEFSNLPSGVSIDSVFAAIVPLPEKVFMPPQRARRVCYASLEHERAQKLLKEALEDRRLAEDEPLVARLFLTSSISFKKRKRQCAKGELGASPDSLARLPMDIELPHFIWVMEVATRQMYKEGLCLGEVVVDASESDEECEFIYMRVGNQAIREPQTLTDEQAPVEFVQYTHNLGERGT